MSRPKITAILLVAATFSGGLSVLAGPSQNPEEAASPVSGESSTAASAAYEVPWYSLNGGGVLGASSASYDLNHSVGQSVSGRAASATYAMGIGFWYGVGAGGGCPIVMTGDVNVSGQITSADIIGLVNYVFKGGVSPLPCAAAGDVNCNGAVTSADIISLVNFVFKGGVPPCDGCTSPLAVSC